MKDDENDDENDDNPKRNRSGKNSNRIMKGDSVGALVHEYTSFHRFVYFLNSE